MSLMILTLLLLLPITTSFGLELSSNAAFQPSNPHLNPTFNTLHLHSTLQISQVQEQKIVKQARDLESASIPTTSNSTVVLSGGNAGILSENKTFQLGFFDPKGLSKWYLGIWYASIPTPTYVWVANRENPVKNLSSVTLEVTGKGNVALIVSEEDGSTVIVWETSNTDKGVAVKLLEQGNLVLLNSEEVIVWDSFDFPTDTLLPGMNLSGDRWLTCWRSSNDPSPGKYSLRLKPPEFGEIELIFNGSSSYWSSGNWTGDAFSGLPEMTIPYIFKYHFVNPFTPMASFGYTETALESGMKPPLARHHLDFTGQVKQYTWSPQTECWNTFWSQPENLCRVYGSCGNLGLCNTSMLSRCKCLAGFRPSDGDSWDARDYSGGCRRESDDLCDINDGFEEVGPASYDGVIMVSFSATRSVCESTCLKNCSCIGLIHNEKIDLCKNLFGSMFNLRNLTSDGTIEDMLHVRVPKSDIPTKRKQETVVLIGTICGSVVLLVMTLLIFLILRKRRTVRRKKEEEAAFPVTNLKVFSYKELHAATKGFSEKLGHGGFGAVFRGELSDSSPVAVKRLERPGGGEREFRAEVCTIGNIQHVNLVRLRGFCSENSHRLLVYDYMPNGPLSAYLKRDSENLSWDIRFRVAIGTARGLAYLHEECRSCIIHCDIKPENILLDEDFSPKVSDFGMAKLIGRDFSRVLATMRGTWGYVAPEWISGVAITTKADVYSYGMTLLELIGGRRNVEGLPSAGGTAGEKWFFPPWAACQIIEGNLAGVVDERLGGLYNVVEAERVGLVAVWCIQEDEAMRPTMRTVEKMLDGVVKLTVPPPPKLLQALVSGDSFQGVGLWSDSRYRVSNGGSDSGDGYSDTNAQVYRQSKDSQHLSDVFSPSKSANLCKELSSMVR